MYMSSLLPMWALNSLQKWPALAGTFFWVSTPIKDLLMSVQAADIPPLDVKMKNDDMLGFATSTQCQLLSFVNSCLCHFPHFPGFKGTVVCHQNSEEK